MLFRNKLDRAQKWLRNQNKDTGELPTPDELKEQSQELPLDKGDLPLMILLAMGIILPVCLLVLIVVSLAGYFFIAR